MSSVSLAVTKHAARRMSGRAISPVVAQVVLDYGRIRRRRGADLYFLDRPARAELRGELEPRAMRRLEQKIGAYLVVSDSGIVITAGYRYRRLKFSTN